MNKRTIIHIHSTPMFLRGNPKREKTKKCFFLYVLMNYIHWKHQFPFFSSCNWKEAPTPYFLKLKPEGFSNSPILWIQLEGGYNPLCSLATTGRSLQPPALAPSNCPNVEVEWWNHCHTITVRYTTITTCTNQPVINLYHKQVDQPCINLYQTTCNQLVP